MTPLLSTSDELNGGTTHAVAKRENRAGLSAEKDRPRGFGGEFRRRLLFATETARGIGLCDVSNAHEATLLLAVGRVIRVCAKKQVRWVHAETVVASMADQKCWQLSMRKQPSNAMGSHHTAAHVGAKVDDSVAVEMGTGSPFPAFIGAATIHLFPEPFRERALGWHTANYLTGRAA